MVSDVRRFFKINVNKKCVFEKSLFCTLLTKDLPLKKNPQRNITAKQSFWEIVFGLFRLF